jgi:hypothetical protein
MTYAIVAYALSAILWALYLLFLLRRVRREVERAGP